LRTPLLRRGSRGMAGQMGLAVRYGIATEMLILRLSHLSLFFVLQPTAERVVTFRETPIPL
jgi:hypothetical protein